MKIINNSPESWVAKNKARIEDVVHGFKASDGWGMALHQAGFTGWTYLAIIAGLLMWIFTPARTVLPADSGPVATLLLTVSIAGSLGILVGLVRWVLEARSGVFRVAACCIEQLAALQAITLVIYSFRTEIQEFIQLVRGDPMQGVAAGVGCFLAWIILRVPSHVAVDVDDEPMLRKLDKLKMRRIRPEALSKIRTFTEHDVSDTQRIIRKICDPTGNGGNDHWSITSANFLVGFSLHLVYLGKASSITEVAECLYNAESIWGCENAIYKDMLTIQHDQENQMHWPDVDGQTGIHPVIAHAARVMQGKEEKERTSILETSKRFLAPYLVNSEKK